MSKRTQPTHRSRRSPENSAPPQGWVWGLHAGRAVLSNPARDVFQTLATRNAARDLETRHPIETVAPGVIDAALPPGAVHQGLAVRCAPLAPVALEVLAQPPRGVLIILDQITDPHNVGAVLRSAAAFGARGLVMQDRKAAPLMGACAKAAVGATERIPHARVVNIARALDDLRDAGWRVIGLDGDAPTALGDGLLPGDDGVALVLGSEDKGLRPAVAAACAVLARIPIVEDAALESLNVSNAAAIALYEASRRCANA